MLHLIPRFNRGGAERVICELALGMRESHIQGFIACSGGDWTKCLDRLELPWLEIPLFPSNPIKAVRSFFSLRRIVRQYQIDLIHSHNRFSSLIGHLVAKCLNIPFVCTVHDLAWGKRFITRLGLGKTVMVFSQAVESHLVEHFGLKQEYIKKISMGVAPPVGFTPEQILKTKIDLGCAAETPIVGFIGRLVYEKAPNLFLRAIPQVLTRFPHTKFWFVGEGEMRNELESLSGRLRIREKVLFLGGRDDVYSLMSCFDFVVVPSLREGFGLVALEALTYGKPVIATIVGGLPELVQNEWNGLLVPPGQPAAIAEAIIRLLGDRDLVLRMGARAREMVRDRFSLEAMFREIGLVYKYVLQSHQ